MRESNLVAQTDKKFDMIMSAWIDNINASVTELILNGSHEFYNTTTFFVQSELHPNREFVVTKDIQTILRRIKKTNLKCQFYQQKTILIGYDTRYLQPMFLEVLFVKLRAKRAYSDVVFSQITALKMTQSIDYLLASDYYVPDLIFVVIRL